MLDWLCYFSRRRSRRRRSLAGTALQIFLLRFSFPSMAALASLRSAWEEAVVARVRKEVEVSELRMRERIGYPGEYPEPDGSQHTDPPRQLERCDCTTACPRSASQSRIGWSTECQGWSTSKSSIGWSTCGGYDTGYAVSDLGIESAPTDERTESGEP